MNFLINSRHLLLGNGVPFFFSKFHVKVDLGIPGLSGLFPQTLKLVLRDLVGCRGLGESTISIVVGWNVRDIAMY